MRCGVVAVVLLLLSGPFRIARADDDWAELRPRPEDHLGTLSCSSVSCHGRIQPHVAYGGSQGQEYRHWLEAPDPHALAGQRLLEPPFQEMLRRASQQPDGTSDPLVYRRCAGCHDPLGLPEGAKPTDPQGPNALTLALSQRERGAGHGIGCESCHGGARRWLAKHYERDVNREELHALGMIDTKNVLLRARLCASCHVGSAENDVNHDLLAAGHPPLRFELAAYHALLTHKHWDDAPRRLAEPDYEVQLWAAGRIASAEAALELLEGRGKQAAQRNDAAGVPYRAPWPEFAESNCFACHQNLRPETGRLFLSAAIGRPVGVPPWQAWNLELTPADEAFGASLIRLRAVMEQSLVPPPEPIAALAAEARAALREQVQVDPAGTIFAATGKTLGPATLLERIAVRPGPPTWERCCHELLALAAAERAIRDRSKPRPPVAVYPQSATSGRGFARLIHRAAASLRFTTDRSEWPAVFTLLQGWQPADTMSLEEVAAELEEFRVELARHCNVLGTDPSPAPALRALGNDGP